MHMQTVTAQIQQAVHQLKVERDTWQAVALQYKAALEDQTARLEELRDICFATQADLENERARQCPRLTCSDRSQANHPGTVDGAADPLDLFGTAVIFTQDKVDQQPPPHDLSNPVFLQVQRSADQRNYGVALMELDRLLRGPLSPKARAEGLLLKSSILHAVGPDELYEALAACSEAMELCHRLSELESFLPSIQHQRSLIYHQLRVLSQAKDAFSAVTDEEAPFSNASDHYSSCDEDAEPQHIADRRSGFDQRRTFDQDILVHLDNKLETRRRRKSAQSRLRAAVKAKRMPLPHRWVSGKDEGS